MAEKQTVATFISQSSEFLQKRHAFYQPLNPARQEIRLMHIQPGQRADAIHITLHAVDLADEAFYETVSYTWEDVSAMQQVYIHDVAYNVTMNQYAALRRLRLPEDIKVLWMDVICIDQADLQERAHQVSIMGDVYANAARTNVWLGDSDESWYAPMSDEVWSKLVSDFEKNRDMTSVFKVLPSASRGDLMARFLEVQDPVKRAEFILHQLAADLHLGDLPYCSFDGEDLILCRQWYDAVRTLLVILQRPWWTRVWVLQEVFLCKGEPQVLFGPHVMPFDVFMKAADSLGKHGLMIRCCMDTMMAVFFSKEILDCLFHVRTMNSIRTMNSPGHMSLFKGVQLARRRNTTDTRDHVYGVLGLVAPGDRVEVDYTLTTKQVFASTSWQTIKSSNTLTWLVKGGLPEPTRTPSIPTWSVDWVDADRQGFRYWDSWDMDEEPDWTRTKYEEGLELVANELSEIRLVLAKSPHEDELSDCQNHHSRLWAWLEGLKDAGFAIHLTEWTTDKHRNSELFFDFFTTILCDTIADFDLESADVVWTKRLGDKEWEVILSWWNTLNRCVEQGTEREYAAPEQYMLVMAFVLCTVDCTLALTTGDRLCLVPDSSRVGDVLYHIRACCPPIVLRDAGKGVFQVVGAAYLRGSMGSEGWSKEQEKVITLV